MTKELKLEEIYDSAINKWGCAAQIMMAMGECAELIAVLNEHFNQGRGDGSQVIDEIADVEIMCGQLRRMFNSEEIDARKQYKLERLKGIIDGDIPHEHQTREE